jgi:DNA primase large subunit
LIIQREDECTSQGLTKLDLAKYPFSVEASEYIQSLNISLTELDEAEFSNVLERAEDRISKELTQGKLEEDWQDDEVEVLSYAVAIYLMTFVPDDRVRRRFAVAESKRAYRFLRTEADAKILHLATKTFRWDAKILAVQIKDAFYEFALSFRDYLRNAARMHEPAWKLSNRILHGGYVYLTKDEFARLLAEEVKRRILNQVASSPPPHPSSQLAPRIERIRSIATSMIGGLEVEELPQVVVEAILPPCMKNLLALVSTGKDISHLGRFALTAFLLNVGATNEDVIRMFNLLTDYDERLTRYQVEHISGSRGSRRKYIPPSCRTMRTHGLCFNPNGFCATIKHPLAYYKKRARTLPRGVKLIAFTSEQSLKFT